MYSESTTNHHQPSIVLPSHAHLAAALSQPWHPEKTTSSAAARRSVFSSLSTHPQEAQKGGGGGGGLGESPDQLDMKPLIKAMSINKNCRSPVRFNSYF